MSRRYKLKFNDTPGGSYPAVIVTAGRQSQWDWNLSDGISQSAVGPRYATNKTLGVDTLPTGSTYSSGFLIITQSATFDRWNFNISGLLGVIARGNSTTVTFNDCKFGTQANNPAINSDHFYGIQASDDSTTPTVNVNYCEFDGGRYDSNVGVSGPWSGSAIYVTTGSTLSATRSVFKGCGYDVIKTTNATLNFTFNRVQAFGWNVNSDADGVQMIGGAVTVEDNLWDVRDGGLVQFGGVFTGYLNSAIFCTVDVPSTMNGTPVVRRNVFVGWGDYGTSRGTPYNVVNIADNHTLRAGPHEIINGVWEDNVLDPGNSGTWIADVDYSSSVAIASWARNYNFDTGALITAPSF